MAPGSTSEVTSTGIKTAGFPPGLLAAADLDALGEGCTFFPGPIGDAANAARAACTRCAKRSEALRSSVGAACTEAVAAVFGWAGFDIVIIEEVGSSKGEREEGAFPRSILFLR